jgi:hypothetical protein
MLVAAVGLARLVCWLCDLVSKPPAERGMALEPRNVDAEFAAIVATNLADLGTRERGT